jgi:hypothetical protein
VKVEPADLKRVHNVEALGRAKAALHDEPGVSDTPRG